VFAARSASFRRAILSLLLLLVASILPILPLPGGSGRIVGPVAAQAAPRYTGEAAAADAASKVSLVREAFSAIYGGYFDPVNGSDLLNAAWTAAVGAARGAGNAAPPDRPDLSGSASMAYARFATAYQLLESATPIDQTALAYQAIRGMVSFIDNCHTYFLTPTQAAAQRASLSGQGVVGTGIRRSYSRPWVVTYVVPDGPADLAGIRPGDMILAYDGDSGDNAPSTHAKFAGETLVYTIQRPGEAAPRDVSVVVDRFRFPRIEARIIGGDVGYLRFFDWETGSAQADAIRDAVAQFQQQGVTSLVIDVRANGGGFPASIANLFVTSGVIDKQQYRSGAINTLNADGSALAPNLPLAILIGPGSASASEIVPEAIRESGRAILIGEHTEGCMAGTNETPLSDGSSIWVTVVHILVGASGQDFEGVGVDPDIYAPQTAADLAAGSDAGIDAAINYLHSQTEPALAR